MGGRNWPLVLLQRSLLGKRTQPWVEKAGQMLPRSTSLDSAGQLNGRVLVFVLRCRLCGTMDDDLEQGCMFEGGADSADTDPSCGICLECAAPAPRARAARLTASFGARLTPGRCSRVAGRSRSVARSEAASTSSASAVSSTGRRCTSRPRARCARWPSARS